jgi:hydroxyacylglutathione hydrolase
MAKVEFTTSLRNPDGVNDVDPSEVLEKVSQVKIIDVRRPEEFTGELGHIPGAKLMPLDSLPTQIGNLPKEDTYVFVCRSGGRSSRAGQFARAMGYDNVYNMKGGMLLWNELGFKVATE